ncbi:SMP-30/gluconolactonase/LRE family protein [Erythrobacter dokdonensis]|uniref:SMP-30/gluconolactonase/LRE family protein n=1 Tax=Erythrobacter dokdonensis TaxID=328225 RepID=UPI0013021291|nr:SMP-30/gluconolactonase/LRE family protein [Erythrobacter dokdonensis]
MIAQPLLAEERAPASGPPALEAAIAQSQVALDAILNGDPSLYRRFGSEWRLVHRHADPITTMRAAQPDASTDFARRYAAAWSSQKPEAVAAFFAEDGRLVVNDGEPAVGRAAIADVARGFMEAFPDLVVAFDKLGERDGRRIFHWTLTGTNTGPGGTGASVRISGVEAWAMGPDGLIADSGGSFDAADYARQLEAGASGKAQAGYTLFPADRSLTHAEDGVVLPDGRLLVGDWDHGLVTLDPDGTKRPFGNFAAAGFRTRPDPLWNSPNGISWEPDGRHVLVADITGGHIYRVDTRTQAVARIYDHPFGVNAAVRDPSGAIWFTQSTENAAGEGSEARMFAAADKPLGDGSVWRIAAAEVGKNDPQAVKVVEGLDFANGIVFDAPRGRVYVNEIVASRILSFAVDPQTGALSDRRVLVSLPTPDNIELDANGDLWVTSPFANAVYKVDADTGDRQTIFAPTPEASARMVSETYRRLEAGEGLLSLLGPDIWGPMPGLLTGLILAPDGTVYVSGLGDALVKLDGAAETDTDLAPILDNRTRVIIAGIRSGDVSQIMALYGPASLYAADNVTLLSDPGAIREFWVNVAASPAHDATLEVLRIERLGPDAFVEIQKYDVFDAGGERLFGGYASLLWRKVGGRWMIAADVSN